MKIYYENSKGDVIDFLSGDIAIQDPESLFGWDWSYNSVQSMAYGGSIQSLYKGVQEKDFTLAIFCDSEKEFKRIHKRIEDVFIYDIAKGKEGKLWVNEYYINCYVTSKSYDEYNDMFYESDCKFKIACQYPMWRKENKVPIFAKSSEITGGTDMPLDFAFDFGMAKASYNTFENDCVASSPFRLVIAGPCEDPEITIAGHTYKINGEIAESETVEIVSIPGMGLREVTKYGADRSSANWFGHRDKESSIFEPIPAGVVSVEWDQTFDFELTLLEERNEPPWFMDKDEEEEVVDARTYWLDAYGDTILDAHGDKIAV